MAVDIQVFQENKIYVNDKLVIRDNNEEWHEKIELTTNEREAFIKHLRQQSGG